LEFTRLVVIGTDYIGSCKSSYHAITITTAPVLITAILLKVALNIITPKPSKQH
jgi:hypothetical protein